MRDGPSKLLVIKRNVVMDKGHVVEENPMINYMTVIRKFRQKTIL